MFKIMNFRKTEINRSKLTNPLNNIDFIFKLTKLGKESDDTTKLLHKFTENVVLKRLKENNIKSDSKRLAFLDMLINSETENGGKLSVQDLREEVDTFMFAGHDTNATSLIWTLYLLGQNIKEQNKLIEEIDEVFPSSSFFVSSENLRSLPYMEMVIKESLRMFPPVSMIARRISETTVLDGNKLPAGTNCSIMIFAIHRNPEFWKNPTHFDPERFNLENSSKRHPFAFIPFSAGPRNCLGQKFSMNEQKVILSKFFKKFTVSTSVKEEDLEISMGLITTPMNVTFTIRERVI